MLKIGLAVLLLCWLSGCATVSWYGQAVRGQIELLCNREDIAELIADPATSPQLREQLAYALEAREFAEQALGLPEGRSYRLYADLGREAAVWNVVATPRYSMSPRTWCYPVAGCLSYRGYFRPEAAERKRQRLADDNMDAAVFPVTAYSTLGWFADPVLNTMLSRGNVRLAGLIFHELAHERLFVRGDTAFNEAYATFIEREGIRRWLTQRGELDILARWQRDQALEQQFVDLLLEARTRLIELYATDLDETEMQRRKQSQFEMLRQDYADFAERHETSRFDAWFDRELNNAHLAMVATYESGVQAFARLLDKCEGSLDCFHAQADRLAGQDRETRRAFLGQTD